MRRLADPVTLCDGHGFFFVAASGQIRMAANTLSPYLAPELLLLINGRTELGERSLAPPISPRREEQLGEVAPSQLAACHVALKQARMGGPVLADCPGVEG